MGDVEGGFGSLDGLVSLLLSLLLSLLMSLLMSLLVELFLVEIRWTQGASRRGRDMRACLRLE